MQEKLLILMPFIFGIISADYVGPQNGFSNNKNGNSNGNAYGVPPDSITPPQQGGPYPPSGWKPAGRRLLLPGESRNAQQPIDSGYGQPPPPLYGVANPSPTSPPINSQYGPSVDNTVPPNNQYIPGTGFANGGNKQNGNGHNGNGHSNGGNGFANGNGHSNGGNGFANGNGHSNGGNGFANGNGHSNGGNGFANGNGHKGSNGFSNGNGNGHKNGNGIGSGVSNGNGGNNGGNGFVNDGSSSNGHNGNNGNGHNGNGLNGNGNAANGKGSNGANGSNGHFPSFHGSFPSHGTGLIYPFVQLSVPATVAAVRPGNGAGTGIYSVFQIPNSQAGTGFLGSSFPISTENSFFPLTGAYPSFQTSVGAPDISTVYPGIQVTGTQDVTGTYPAVLSPGSNLIGNGIGQYYTLLSNGHSHKSNILGVKNGLSNLQAQYAVGHSNYGFRGVPLNVF